MIKKIERPYEFPYERNGIISPGLPVLPPGIERYPVLVGNLRGVMINDGDEISVLSPEGLQTAELTFFAENGSIDLSIFEGIKKDSVDYLKFCLLNQHSTSQNILSLLKQHQFDLSRLCGVKIFEESHQSQSGEIKIFNARMNGLLILGVPHVAMLPWEQNTSSDIILYVKRASIDPIKNKVDSIPLLADPLTDLNIQPGQAKVYEVKKGEYIQILDIQGRECSDFQAFSRRALDKGLEREIDPTTTRSLMGSLYPAPGVYSKYFTSDQEALVEIVEDTCGRHDTFGLACFARYYEDLGYPGHLNCTDNINKEIDRYDVKSRGGWHAINFFFNTQVDANYSIFMDDPWSRPGDYVLLRALTDLVCVSTACPCDVDPANGWNPTDIQVRVYRNAQE